MVLNIERDDDLNDLAFDLFREVHGRLNHDSDHYQTLDGFKASTARMRAWVEIARSFNQRLGSGVADWEALAYELFCEVHSLLQDEESLYLHTYYDSAWQPRRVAWEMIARVFRERLTRGTGE